MPSSMTHTYFALDVYNKLPKNYQNKIKNNLEYYKLFAQGSDPFMFYHFCLGKKSKQISKIHNVIHTTKTRDFFINTITYIHQNKLINNKEAMAYLYGHICHYYLDIYTHPFIFYKTGIFNKKKKETFKYNAMHQDMEYFIDMYLIQQKETIPISKYKVYENIFKVNSFSPTINNLIINSIEKTYNLNNITKLYLKCTKYMTNFFKYINYDPYQLKYHLYKLIDKLTPPNIIKLQELSFNRPIKDKMAYLNLEHHNWHYPWNKNLKDKSSFLDLYEKAQNQAITTIIKITDMLISKELDITKLNQIFTNQSYRTGQDCNKKITMKFFEF